MRVNILAMFPVLEEKYSVFTTKSDANCRVFVDVPYQIGLILLIPKKIRIQRIFSALHKAEMIRMIHGSHFQR